ncbi:alpha/beta fold hydrolase [Telmatospirillum siberiense]|uniref:Alpha/beta hydrolase n=1 Tax=Telmatospirillum siberiense TaxID=382514 RepID=A0A2N3PND0_9PROT|nr:alpha/beta hydrolase [Telmatospirillum siberiense]PKU21890.1 alpha/beta hydrolase [Telmatospirillum siberiense]
MKKQSMPIDDRLTRRTVLTGLLAATVAACSTPGEQTTTGEVPADRKLLGHTLHGSGPEPVIVLHEWMGDHTNYDLMLPFLPEDKYRWIFADLRGYGLSKPITGAYSLREAADDVLRLMDSYGHHRFHLVGHSMSGMISQYVAKIGGERLKSVVLVSPVPASGFRADAETMKKLAAIIDDDDAARAAIMARGGTRYGRGWIERKLAMTRRAPNRDAMLGYLKMFTGTDVAAEVSGVATPITAVCGMYDLPLYREDSIRTLLAPLFPNLEVAVSHEAGHYAMLETPPLLAGQFEKGIARGL